MGDTLVMMPFSSKALEHQIGSTDPTVEPSVTPSDSYVVDTIIFI